MAAELIMSDDVVLPVCDAALPFPPAGPSSSACPRPALSCVVRVDEARSIPPDFMPSLLTAISFDMA